MKFLITGGWGLLGSEIYNQRKDSIRFNSNEINLLNFNKFNEFLEDRIYYDKIDCVIHCAARVGGVLANINNQQDFLETNLKINDNVFRACENNNVKLVSILSSCIYPDKNFVNYPLTEDQLHNGPPHNSNYGYAYSKRMLEIKTRAHNEKSKNKFICLIPNNLYGLNDNFNLDNSHVIPGLIHKFHLAKINKTPIKIWGTGEPIREFTFAEDMAKNIIWLAENYSNELGPLNIGNVDSISIKNLVEKINSVVQPNVDIIFDSSMPNGQHEKPTCTQKFMSLGYQPDWTSLDIGLEKTYKYFLENYDYIRK